MEELISVRSKLTVKETTDRVMALIQEKGFKVFERINHSAEAIQQGLTLRPTELILFGNPTVGTILMQDRQTCGIDLPAKILVWEDESETVWLTYNGMSRLKKKHQLTDESMTTLKRIGEVVAGICRAAAGEKG